MERTESYIHTRNYGCRIRHYTYNNVEMLSMENQKIKLVISVGKGADIVEFVHKPSDTDFMWHSFNELKNINHIPTVSAKAGNFLDSYSGGWQELFPVYGGDAIYHGAELGIHGEACIYPWVCDVITDEPECIEVKLTLRTIRSPFLLEKHIKLLEDDSTMYMTQKITNLGCNKMDFMWGHHPAFGFPFLDDSVKLHLKGTPHTLVPGYTITKNCPFDKETEGAWPYLPDKNGEAYDLSRVRSAKDKILIQYLISDLEEGKYELINHKKNLGIRMSWDPEIFRYLWVWALYSGLEEYPWYGRSYVFAVEPWSSAPGRNYDDAKKAGTLLHLEPGKSIETSLQAQLFENFD